MITKLDANPTWRNLREEYLQLGLGDDVQLQTNKMDHIFHSLRNI